MLYPYWDALWEMTIGVSMCALATAAVVWLGLRYSHKPAEAEKNSPKEGS